jgi:phosphohistidine swiveling domain-containing protein
MLEVFNRSKIRVGLFRSNEVLDVSIHKRLNSDDYLTFALPMNSEKYPLLEHEGLVKCEGQLYVIKKKERKRNGLSRLAQYTCNRIMHRMIDIRIPYSQAVEEAFGKDISYFLNIISNATGGVFTFQVMDTIPPTDVYNWGYSNCLKGFQDIVNAFGVEFVSDNYNIKIYKKITIDNGGVQYRIKKNIISDEFETNTTALVSRMTGLAKDSLTIIDLAASHLTTEEYSRLNAISGAIVGGIIKVPYLISQYAASWATPDNAYFDGDFEATDIEADDVAGKLLLLAEIRKKLIQQEIPDIQVKVHAADLWKIDSQEIRPQIGETVYLVDPKMELNNIEARVVELTEYPFDKSKHTQVTIANYILQDYDDIIADLDASKNQLERLLTNGKVNTSVFETFARQAVIDINNAKSQIIYDTRGEVMQSTVNALHQMILTSEGLIITTDGGTTANTAITAAGIAAPYVVGILGEFAQVKTDNLIAGSALISSALIASLKVEKLDVSTAKITSAMIESIIASKIEVGTLTGFTLTGSLIQTSTSYPRSEMTAAGNYFGAFANANKSIKISPYFIAPGDVVLSFADGAYDSIMTQSSSTFFISSDYIQLSADIYLQGETTVPNWNSIVTVGGVSLQSELGSKATAGAATISNGAHNHGITPGRYIQTYDSVGNPLGYQQWVTASAHAHNQT